MWIGLGIGVVLGALIWKLEGAIVLGFFGWLVGVVVDSRRRGPSKPVEVKKAEKAETLRDRVERLEKRVAELEKLVIPAEAGIQPEAEAVVEPPPPAPPPLPAEPSKPNPILAWLTGGNTIARVGLVILFIGLAFLLKYAADQDLLPVELRVGAVAIGGIALLILGWRLRHTRRAYGLALQGGGVAVLYLTTFASLRLWHLIPAEAAFFMLAAIALFSAILAIKQDAQVLAVFGAGGGFLAPVLASTGQGSHVMLFSYFLVLNLGIAAVALYKAWRPLNLVGFIFTFLISLAWGLKYFNPDIHFESTEPFLIAFFLLYVVIAVLFARNQAPSLTHYVDGTIVFGVPLAVFGLQAGMVWDREFYLSFSALAMSAVYLLAAFFLKRTKRESYSLLAEAFIALSVVFATVAIPLALDARWTSAAWALEGAAIVWVGARQGRKLARAFGILLQFAAGLAYVEGAEREFFGAVVIAFAGLWTSRLVKGRLSPYIFTWGLLWWLFAGHHEIVAFIPRAASISAHVGFLAATALVLGIVALRLEWNEAAWGARLLLPALIPFALLSVAYHRHPFGEFGWIAWPAAILVHLWVMRRLEPEAKLADALHAGGMMLVAGLGAKELNWVAAEYTAHDTAWSAAAIAVVPALLLILTSSRSVDYRWPMQARPLAYREGGAWAIVLGLAAWSLYVNVTRDGKSDPLPYLPLLNALDLGHVLVIFAVIFGFLALRRTDGARLPGKGAAWAFGVVIFIWLNAALLRTLHHWTDIPYTFPSMRRSIVAQASLSVFWSVLALSLMIYATRNARRALWMVGAGLMGVVVVKLFLVDFAHVGGIARIVSFIVVGALMLVIGYFSPVPPRKS